MSEAVSLYPEDWPTEETFWTDEPDDNDPFVQWAIDREQGYDCE